MRKIAAFLVSVALISVAVSLVSAAIEKWGDAEETARSDTVQFFQGITSESPKVVCLPNDSAITPLCHDGDYTLVTAEVGGQTVYGYISGRVPLEDASGEEIYNILKQGVVRRSGFLNMRLQPNREGVMMDGQDISVFGKVNGNTPVTVFFRRGEYFFVQAEMDDGRTARGFIYANRVTVP